MAQRQRSRPGVNVFRDLEFSADEAAELLDVTQPRINDLMRGRIDLFNIEMLIDMLSKLGFRTKIARIEPEVRWSRVTLRLGGRRRVG